MMTKSKDQNTLAHNKFKYSFIGSYKVLRDTGESRLSAIALTPIYHLLRPKK